MLYQSMKLTNGIWVLAELRVQAGNPNYAVSTLCESTTHGDVRQAVIPEPRLTTPHVGLADKMPVGKKNQLLENVCVFIPFLFSVPAASFPIK